MWKKASVSFFLIHYQIIIIAVILSSTIVLPCQNFQQYRLCHLLALSFTPHFIFQRKQLFRVLHPGMMVRLSCYYYLGNRSNSPPMLLFSLCFFSLLPFVWAILILPPFLFPNCAPTYNFLMQEEPSGKRRKISHPHPLPQPQSTNISRSSFLFSHHAPLVFSR